MFLLYINDIGESINSSIRLFADDTSFVGCWSIKFGPGKNP